MYLEWGNGISYWEWRECKRMSRQSGNNRGHSFYMVLLEDAQSMAYLNGF